jgi:hypothetical protein
MVTALIASWTSQSFENVDAFRTLRPLRFRSVPLNRSRCDVLTASAPTDPYTVRVVTDQTRPPSRSWCTVV